MIGIGLVGYVRRAIDRASDERNVATLARRLGCSMDDARALYQQARTDGYGAAIQRMHRNGRRLERRQAPAKDRPIWVGIDRRRAATDH